MITITHEQFERAVLLVREAGWGNSRGAVNATLSALGIEVEKTPEERIAAFVEHAKQWNRIKEGGLWPVIASHFPEVLS